MSEQDKKKAEELKQLLERLKTAGSFESASISGKIVTLAGELFSRDTAAAAPPAEHQAATTRN